MGIKLSIWIIFSQFSLHNHHYYACLLSSKSGCHRSTWQEQWSQDRMSHDTPWQPRMSHDTPWKSPMATYEPSNMAAHSVSKKHHKWLFFLNFLPLKYKNKTPHCLVICVVGSRWCIKCWLLRPSGSGAATWYTDVIPPCKQSHKVCVLIKLISRVLVYVTGWLRCGYDVVKLITESLAPM